MLKYLNINDLVELSNNPRQIGNKDLEILKNSIKNTPELLEARPLIINNIENQNIVIAGNQRLKALKELGYKEAPCFVFENLPLDKQKEITLKDNINNGFWDIDKLALDYKDIDLKEIGLDTNLNIDEKEIEESTNQYIKTQEILQDINDDFNKEINNNTNNNKQQTNYKDNNENINKDNLNDCLEHIKELCKEYGFIVNDANIDAVKDNNCRFVINVSF